MARSVRSAWVKIHGMDEVGVLLNNFAAETQAKTLETAIRQACRVVIKEAKKIVSPPGYKGDKPGLVPLKDTIEFKVVTNTKGTLGMVGPRRPDGAHGHLVEFGHTKVLWGNRTSGRVRPYPFLRPAADTTQSAQQSAMINYLKKRLATVRSRG